MKADDPAATVAGEKKAANNRLSNPLHYQSKQYYNTNLVKKISSFKLQTGVVPAQTSDKALRPKVMKIKEKDTVKDTPAR